MNTFDKLQPFFILSAMGIGLALGRLPQVGGYSISLVAPFLLLMLTGVFLHVPLRGLTEALRSPRFTTWNLGLNFVWVPVFCWILGRVFLSDQPDLRIGLLMLLVTPCTDWYLVFTQVTGGNARLAASQLPWHLVLQLILLPVYLLVFADALVPLNVGTLFGNVLWMLAVPIAAAAFMRAAILRVKGRDWFDQHVLPRVPLIQSLFLLLAIAAMFASQESVLNRLDVVVWLLPPLMAFYVVSLLIGLTVGRYSGFSREDTTALCFATLCRNSPLSLAIAVIVFPDRPLIALALVIEPLIELPVVSLISHLLKRAHFSCRATRMIASTGR